MRIVIVGCGYVELVTETCLAHLGHHVICVDRDERRIAALLAGRMPIYEKGLGLELHGIGRRSGRARRRATTMLRIGPGEPQLAALAL